MLANIASTCSSAPAQPRHPQTIPRSQASLWSTSLSCDSLWIIMH